MTEKKASRKLIVGITAPGSVILLKGQLKYFAERGYETYLLAPSHERTIAYCKQEGCKLLPVPIEREISILADLIALWHILRHFWRIQPDIVNVGTPKMGLLGMIAARIVGVKKRVYTCRGFRYEHEQGGKRKLLMVMEWIAGLCAHSIICISQSVKERGVTDSVFSNAKCQVINKGSSNGIDIKRFSQDNVSTGEIEDLKEKLEIQGHFVYGFVGRIIDRKGCKELFEAFRIVYDIDDRIRLLLVGLFDHNQLTDKTLPGAMKTHPGVIMAGRTDNVPLYLSCIDVFVLPAWWEGFGNVLVEAAAMQIPVISTNGTGTKDAVNDGYNGVLVDVRSVEPLADAMCLLKEDSDLRQKLANNGRKWAANFDSTTIWNGMKMIYEA
ncbi:MAG: glycosyltransferase family 4 protein [Lewinella sp.]|uniref:glycosyltransferase family 4 protein n=1 Tax=Lewinella sp. TaxID=2004506 RepID=UPI003D6A7D1E